MWQLSNQTPFAAQESWTRDENGHEVWLIAIKASFEMEPDGKQVLLKEQLPLNMSPIFADDPNELLDDDDLNIEKKHTDVLVSGHAYAANGRPDTQTVTRLTVGDIDKTVNVIGNRVLIPGPASVRMSHAEPFLRLPITWRRSYGGSDYQTPVPDWEQRNPVGVGFAVNSSNLISKTAPNFEYANAPYRGPNTGRPAGYGPIGRHWMPRMKYAGTYGDAWEKTRDPLLPLDFDRMFYQCAPEDQQSHTPLVGYEQVQLGNLTADGYLQFLLPRITFDIVTTFYKGPDQTHDPATMHTLRIMPDQRQFSMTWISALPCPYDDERLKMTTVSVRSRTGVSESIVRTGVWVEQNP